MSLKSYFRKDDGRWNPLGFIGLGVILLGLIPIALIVVFWVFWIYQFRVNGPKAIEAQTQLETEFRSIKPLPDSTALFYHATNSPGQALVSDTYRTSLSYAQVRKYYDSELTKRGWSFYMEEPLTEWGKDYGGKAARYCKGPYRADLEWAGQGSSNDWDYGFSMSWGLDDPISKPPCQ